MKNRWQEVIQLLILPTILLVGFSCTPDQALKKEKTDPNCGVSEAFDRNTRKCVFVSLIPGPPLNTLRTVNINEDTATTVTLTYLDSEAHLASSCTISGESTDITSGACSCVGGVCQVLITPDPDFAGAAEFYYTLTDEDGTNNATQVQVNVLPIDDLADVTMGVNAVLFEDVAQTIGLNYVDIDNPLGATQCELRNFSDTNITVGSCFCSGLGICSVDFTPDANYFNSTAQTFEYRVFTGSVWSNWGSGIFTVTAVNDAPVLTASATSTATIVEDAAPTSITLINGALSFNDEESDNIVSCTISNQVGLTVNNCVCVANVCTADVANTTIHQNSAGGYSFSFRYTVTDDGTPSAATSAQKTVNVTVTADNDEPTISSVSNSPEDEDNTITVDLTLDEGGLADENSQTLSLTFTSADITLLPYTGIAVYRGAVLVGTASSAASSISLADGATDAATITNYQLRLTPIANASGGPINLTVTVNDGTDNNLVAHNVSLQWDPVDDAPELKTPFSVAQCTYGNLCGAGGTDACTDDATPLGAVIPSAVGIYFLHADPTSNVNNCYVSIGITDDDWELAGTLVSSSNLIPEQEVNEGVEILIKLIVDEGGGIAENAETVGIVIKKENAGTDPDYNSSLLTNNNLEVFYADNLPANIVNANNDGVTSYPINDGGDNLSENFVYIRITPEFGQFGYQDVTVDLLDSSGETTSYNIPVRVRSIGAIHGGWSDIKSVGPKRLRDSTTNLRDPEVTLAWNAFTVGGTGDDAGAAVAGWNVYRRKTNEFYNYDEPINNSLLAANTRTFTDNDVAEGVVYFYKVRPVDSFHGEDIATQEVFSEVRIISPTANMAFAHRWMINKEICEKMHMTPNAVKDYSCFHRGPAEAVFSGFYRFDISQDYLVDQFETGCAYTKAKCDFNSATANDEDEYEDCIGVADPIADPASVTTDLADNGNVSVLYYNRNLGRCYQYVSYDNGTDQKWLPLNGCDYTTTTGARGCDLGGGFANCIGSVDPETRDSSGIATQVIVPQDAANSIYYNNLTGSCWLADSSAVSGWKQIQTANHFVDFSNARPKNSFGDGMYGAWDNDVYLSLNTPHLPPLTYTTKDMGKGICSRRTVTSTDDEFQGVEFEGITFNATNTQMRIMTRPEQMALSAWNTSLSNSTINSYEQGLDLSSSAKCNTNYADGLGTGYSDAAQPLSAFLYSLPGTASSGIRSIYTGSEQTKNCQSRFGLQDIIGNVSEWVDLEFTCYPFDFAVNDIYDEFICGGSALSTISTYAFNGTTMPCIDSDLNGSCDTSLNDWAIADESYSAGKWSFPYGLPFISSYSSATNDLLEIGPSSGITASQLFSDTFAANTVYVCGNSGNDADLNDPEPYHCAQADHSIVELPDGTDFLFNTVGALRELRNNAAMVTGGSYADGNSAGRYYSSILRGSDVGVNIGFRCLLPIESTDYETDDYYNYTHQTP